MPIQLTELHACDWCEKPIHTVPGSGRPRVYCSRACQEASYKERKRATLKPTEKLCGTCFLIHAGDECP